MSSPSFLQLLVVSLAIAGGIVGVCNGGKYSRDDFPTNFIFGSGTSAYQVEGAAMEDGRTPSIWDTFTHAGGAGGATGDIACDHYHKYKEDVQLMANIGLEAYRFSISWSRLIPNGRGPVSPKGLQFYNSLINELLSHGIQPHVALFNFDLPQALEDKYGGWIRRKIVKDFTVYADVCFREFGDRVQYWSTVNEPNVYALGGYDAGDTPPQRCSPPFGKVNCTRGNSSTEPYLAAHHILLAHASAVRLYREKYQEKQRGFIGLCIYAFLYIPLTDSKEDALATQRANDFLIGWFLDPLVFGEYPRIMKENAGSRIPRFTKAESKIVKGAFDFIGVNHYMAMHVGDNSSNMALEHRDYLADSATTPVDTKRLMSLEVFITPWTLEGVLKYLKEVYGNPPIFIYENGQRMLHNSSLEDTPRVKYMEAYIEGLLNALRSGSDTRGYFTWSFLDAFELLDGYKSSYGLHYVDMEDPEMKRYPKLSAHWYSDFLKGKTVGSGSKGLVSVTPKLVSFQ
ncbi:beta-glucosidase 11-like [Ziziphus jujuba]|uniref:Beta-glucosidase 11-like n=1 Tax=Ziziphus jujuba TaxID=326968 RepID=A0ABM3IWP3_ZIZJJ|nr:beta-glucosidase 11-like [Ziziphus jujuba]